MGLLDWIKFKEHIHKIGDIVWPEATIIKVTKYGLRIKITNSGQVIYLKFLNKI